MTPSPCFDKKTMTDCPERKLHCRSTCPKWKTYEEQKKLEYAARIRQGNQSMGNYAASVRLKKKTEHGKRR